MEKVHLIGIGGTAMAGLASLLKDRGIEVTGSDKDLYPPMSDFLAQKGIEVKLGYSASNLDGDIDLVVIGNALSRGNEEVEAVLERRLPYRSLPEVLRHMFLEGRRNIVVAGTHGKTTVSSLIAWILKKAGEDPGFFIGGIPKNFGTGAMDGKGEMFVVEGDEYDTAFFDKRPKFLHYLPWIVTVGALEYDHADIYGDIGQLMGAFRALMRIVPRNGRLVINVDDPLLRLLGEESPCPVVTCSIGGDAHWRADGVKVRDGKVIFRVVRQGNPLGECAWGLPGNHNVLNALLALAACSEAGVDFSKAREALGEFQGVKRRLEPLGEIGGVILYDDFAHHPTAIAKGLEALRSLHPHSRIWAIVEPRSNSMCRKIFEDELPTALKGADLVIIGKVHRGDSMDPRVRLDPEKVAMEIRSTGKEAWHIKEVSEIAALVSREAKEGDVICVMSNGSFDGIQGLLLEALARRP